MNILGNNSSKLNQVIFENRNQAYGAFEIRESYTDSLKKSILCLTGIVTLLFGSVLVYNKANVSTVENVIALDDPNLEPLEYVTKVDITPVEQRQQAAATAPAGGMATRIVDTEPTPTATVNMNNPVSGIGSPTATGVASTGTETSTVISTLSIAAITASVSADPVIFAEEMPEFEGGNAGLMRYVANSIVYPEIAKEVGAQGVVYVSFVVSETGKVESAKVLKGIGLGCDEEVLRVINKMPMWKKPGKNGGHAVKVRFNIPVSFKLK
jgi:protein TonB